MKVLVDGKKKDLSIIDPKSGVDYFADFADGFNSDSTITYNDEENMYEMNSESYDWWYDVALAHERFDSIIYDIKYEVESNYEDDLINYIEKNIDYYCSINDLDICDIDSFIKDINKEFDGILGINVDRHDDVTIYYYNNYIVEYFDEESEEWVESMDSLTKKEAESIIKDFSRKDHNTEFRVSQVN